jgi:chlorobactene glucosyltransferase
MFVSVIVPARDEEDSIEPCLASLLAQDYLDYEVIVVDDESSDRTSSIVARMSAHDTRLRLVRGTPLPDGWLGKPHALAQGVEASRGDVLVLTDADTVHSPDSISWAVTNLVDHRADVVSGYLAQDFGTWGEKLIVPTMYAMMMLLPLALLPRAKSPQLAFAIGQYVAVRREALDAVGGYESIKSSIVDDMAMAARMKAFGFRNVFVDAKEVAHCRLYSGYRDAFHGTKRSFYAAVGGTLPAA